MMANKFLHAGFFLFFSWKENELATLNVSCLSICSYCLSLGSVRNSGRANSGNSCRRSSMGYKGESSLISEDTEWDDNDDFPLRSLILQLFDGTWGFNCLTGQKQTRKKKKKTASLAQSVQFTSTWIKGEQEFLSEKRSSHMSSRVFWWGASYSWGGHVSIRSLLLG